MLGYVTLGSNDLEKAGSYYDALLSGLGCSRLWETERFKAWGTAMGQPMLLLITPHDEQPATVGNGTMVALVAENTEKVDEIYNKAMELGSPDEGAPGPRGDGFYGAYFRDPEGNKLCVFHMSMG